MNLNPTKKELKKFGLVFSVILLALGFLNLHKGREIAFLCLGLFSLLILLLSILCPKGIKPFYFIITRAGRVIGWINTRVLLILVYYLMLTPMAIIFKLFRKNFLDRSFDKNCQSYWIPKASDSAGQGGYEKQY